MRTTLCVVFTYSHIWCTKLQNSVAVESVNGSYTSEVSNLVSKSEIECNASFNNVYIRVNTCTHGKELPHRNCF